MRRIIQLVVASLLIVACSPSTNPDGPTSDVPMTAAPTTEATAVSSSESPATTAPANTDTPSVGAPGCLADGPRLSEGGFLGRFEAADSDSETLSSITWTSSGECAALSMQFRSASGAPAVGPPEVRAEYLEHTSVLRVEFGGSVRDSALSEQAIDIDLIDKAFVVFDPDADALFVDVHLRGAVRVRVRTTSSPAQIIVEVEESNRAANPTASIGVGTVVLNPDAAGAVIEVQGYATAGEPLDAFLASTGGSVRQQFDLSASPTRWTAFRWKVDGVEPGPVEIRIGDAPGVEFLSR